MSLIKCPECGKEISDKSHICIHCGYSLFAGFIGSNKTINSCGNCGYSWKQ